MSPRLAVRQQALGCGQRGRRATLPARRTINRRKHSMGRRHRVQPGNRGVRKNCTLEEPAIPNPENPGGYLEVVTQEGIASSESQRPLVSWVNDRQVQEAFNRRIHQAEQVMEARCLGGPTFEAKYQCQARSYMTRATSPQGEGWQRALIALTSWTNLHKESDNNNTFTWEGPNGWLTTLRPAP
jgi:hypothetical protein